jgi:hypothetical protein
MKLKLMVTVLGLVGLLVFGGCGVRKLLPVIKTPVVTTPFTPSGKVTVDTDKFTGNITYHLEMYLSGTNNDGADLEASVSKFPGSGQSFNLDFYSRSPSGKYSSCHRTNWLVDGKEFEMPSPSYDSTTSNGAGFFFVNEHIDHLFIMPNYRVGKLVNASSIEFRICLDEFKLTDEQINALRDLASHLDSK